MNLKTRTFLLTILFFFSFCTLAFAQDIKIADVLGTDDPAAQEEVLQQQEQAREDSFVNDLTLIIPSQTDNPSHIITFVDPSTEKKGVQLEIDSKGYQEIVSPYSLPALSIGIHNLSFKFVDSTGATQILDRELIILPRPPIINSPTQSNGTLTISGTGLANSELVLILSSSSDIVTKEATINADGTWSVVVDEALVDGIYSFTGYTRKYGYASNLADAVTFEYGSSNIIQNGVIKKEIHFAFKDIDYKNIGELLNKNLDLIFLLFLTFCFGFILPTSILRFVKSKGEERTIVGLEKKISSKKSDNLTIFEKLNGKSEEKKEEQPKEDVVLDEKKEVVEEKKEERIVTKIDFLKGYKKFDPDGDKKETEVESEKKIKISLTSKG